MEHLGAHHTSGEGINLSVSIPHPQQALVFPEAGAISLATLPKTRGRLLGLSISKFTCFKKKEKKKSYPDFLHGGCLWSRLGSAAGRAASLGHGLSPLGSELPGLCQGLNLHLPAHGILLQRLLAAILGHQKYLKHTRSVRQNLHLREIVPLQHFHSKTWKILSFYRKRTNNCHFRHTSD